MTSIDVARTDQSIQPRPAAFATRLNRLAPPILLAGLVLALPLEFTRQYFPIPSFDLSRLIMVLAIATFAVQVAAVRMTVAIPRAVSFALLLAITAYAVGSALVTSSGNGEKTALAMIVYAVVLLVVFNWAQEPANLRVAWSALAVSTLALAVVAVVLQITGTYIWNPTFLGNGYMRISASFADSNNFGRFLSFGAGIAVLMFADRKPGRLRWVFAAAALASAAANPFTYSRVGWVVFVVCVGLAVVLARNRRRALVLAAAVLALFAVVIFANPGTFARAELIEANLTGPMAHGRFAWLNGLPLDSVRLYLAGAGLQMFLDHPIFGVGFGGFQHAILTTYSDFIPPGRTTTLPHTSSIAILAELGIVGAVMAVTLFGSLFVEMWQSARRLAKRWPVAATAVALVAILIASQYEGRLFEEPYLWVLLGLFYAVAARPLVVISRSRRASEEDQV
jgi:O-antigen ligase